MLNENGLRERLYSGKDKARTAVTFNLRFLQARDSMAELQSTKRVIRSHSLNSVKTTKNVEDISDLSVFAFQNAVFFLDLPKNNVNVKKITTILQGKITVDNLIDSSNL